MNEKPMAVHEVVNLTGITARTLHYYDEIGLLKPSIVTETKYRLYTEDDLSRLQEILFFREVGFALKEIKDLLHSPYYNRAEALEKHLSILEAQKERIESLIALVKAEIKDFLTNQEKVKTLQQFVDTLKNNAKIEYNDPSFNPAEIQKALKEQSKNNPALMEGPKSAKE